MRKLGAALLAIPVLVAVYLGSLGRRGMLGRLSAALAAAAVIVLVIVASIPPAPSAAVRSSQPEPVSADTFMTIGTAHAVTSPFTVAFDTPMDAATVAGALSIEPAGGYSLAWDTAGRLVTISPVGHWQPDTLYRLHVGTSARSLDGGALVAPLRLVVLTARGGTGDIAATRLSAGRMRLDTAFTVRLDRALPLATVEAALTVVPPIAGDVTADAAGTTFTFKPSKPLAANTVYRVSLAGLVDADGVPFSSAPSLKIRTVGAPSVVRFRPRHGSGRIDRGAVLSVRFSDSMAKAPTADAFTVTANGKAVAGTVSWAESTHVLVFDPAKALPYGATVVMTVGDGARSRAGSPISRKATETVKVKPKPAPKPKAKAAHHGGGSVSIPHSGGGGGASGSWSGVERYYLRLMNCTRTGGWVTSSGSCSSPGGRGVAPLALSSGISAHVSRPYARLLATRGQCDHFIGGNPGNRLERAGYSSYRWAENLGCRSGNPYSAVLGSHLFFQNEKPYNGGHYRNLMNAAYNQAGIGVWVSGGRVRLVIDFYHP